MIEARTGELKESNAFAQLIADHIPDMMFVKDKDLNIVRANKAFLEMYDPKERGNILGTSGLEQFPRHQQEMYSREDTKVLGDGYSEVVEENTIYDGTTRTLLTRKIGFKDERSQPFLLGFSRDITEELMAQNKLQAILDTTADGLITIDSEGIVESYNKACEGIFGYASEEVVGQNIKMLMPKRYAEQHDQFILNYLNSGETKIIGIGREVEAQHKNGREFPIYLGISEVMVGKRHFFSGIVRDITRQKAAEEELRRSNEELQDFAYVVSHDLKAPLRHLSLSAGFLAREYGDKLDERGHEFLHKMLKSTDHMQNMIESLLSYARVGQSKRSSFKPVALKEVLGEVLEVMGVTIEESRAQIKMDELPAVTGDKDLLEQLFQNLIQNSIKYAKADTPPEITIDCEKSHGYWRISVADNGIGIVPKYADRVFDIFERLHRDDEYEGVGIGLSICQRIVTFHGGEIWLDKDYDQGAKFVFTLRAA
ncbi:MAG: PAS domain S-box protein [Rhodospirillales bacterium]|nr:PAS domain S-box protein [Rhodospirillales bacterium]